jgi:hypothetical protein
MPPDRNSCDEQRGDESAENSTGPETAFAERMTDHRSECGANTTKRAGKKE